MLQYKLFQMKYIGKFFLWMLSIESCQIKTQDQVEINEPIQKKTISVFLTIHDGYKGKISGCKNAIITYGEYNK